MTFDVMVFVVGAIVGAYVLLRVEHYTGSKAWEAESRIRAQALEDYASWLDRNAGDDWGPRAMVGHARTMAGRIRGGKQMEEVKR
jgi:hypothetical protein